MLDPSELGDSSGDFAQLFRDLSAALTLNSLVESGRIEEAAAFLVSDACPAKLQAQLFVKLREAWESFVTAIKGIDKLMQVLGVQHHETFVQMVRTVRPDLLALADAVAARGKQGQKSGTGNTASSAASAAAASALSDEEAQRVNEMLSKAGLNLTDLLGDSGGQ